MSGHSKWSTIKRQKGANDAKRGQAFTKVANVISLAARLSNSGDPATNPRLRLALESARSINMPKENIQRAIDRGLGNLPGQIMEEASYEGYGPGKVAFLVEAVTDNKNRTLAEVRNLFERSGGGLGSTGSTIYMFDKKGEIRVESQGKDTDDELLELIDAGATDVEEFQDEEGKKYLVETDPSEVNEVNNKITQLGFKVEEYGITYKPNITVTISDKDIEERVLNLAEKLEDHDDIQKVYANLSNP